MWWILPMVQWQMRRSKAKKDRYTIFCLCFFFVCLFFFVCFFFNYKHEILFQSPDVVDLTDDIDFTEDVDLTYDVMTSDLIKQEKNEVYLWLSNSLLLLTVESWKLNTASDFQLIFIFCHTKVAFSFNPFAESWCWKPQTQNILLIW